RANDIARQLRLRLNRLFADRAADWVAYGAVSGFKLVPNYQRPLPATDDFSPYAGNLCKSDNTKDRRLLFAFRQPMLRGGGDLPGFGGMTTAAYTEADVAQIVAAVAGALELVGSGNCD